MDRNIIAGARRTLETFALVECRMAHERVTAVCAADDGSEGAPVKRQPLCPSAVRNRRLACGHSTARNDAMRALAALQDAGALPAPDAAHLRQQLTELGDAIHALDHRKGDAERRLAVEQSQAARDGVAALETEHARYVARLREWMQLVLKALP